MRAVVDYSALGENTIVLDCDVLQADGGTRTAAITGAYVALADAVAHLRELDVLKGEPLKDSCGVVRTSLVASVTGAPSVLAVTSVPRRPAATCSDTPAS